MTKLNIVKNRVGGKVEEIATTMIVNKRQQ